MFGEILRDTGSFVDLFAEMFTLDIHTELTMNAYLKKKD